VKCWKEAETVRWAHGLFQVTHFVHEFLNRVVAFYGAVLDHLQRKEDREADYGFLWERIFFYEYLTEFVKMIHAFYEQINENFKLLNYLEKVPSTCKVPNALTYICLM